jgi:hypothetical protein
MAGCNEHVECLQEKIADYRHMQDIGLICVSIGFMGIGFITTLVSAIMPLLLIGLGCFLLVYGGWKKGSNEAKLCELLRRLPK